MRITRYLSQKRLHIQDIGTFVEAKTSYSCMIGVMFNDQLLKYQRISYGYKNTLNSIIIETFSP